MLFDFISSIAELFGLLPSKLIATWENNKLLLIKRNKTNREVLILISGKFKMNTSGNLSKTTNKYLIAK